MSNKHILITGAGGFVGTHLIKELQQNPSCELYVTIYNATSDISPLIPKDHVLAGDLTDYAFAQKLIQTTKPDIIYHLAALSIVHDSVEKAVSVITSNTVISYNLLEAVRNYASTARVIAICSANQYGAVQDATKPIDESTPLRPLNPYAVSKVVQEMLALEYFLAYHLDIVILRPFNHTGPGQTIDFVIPALAKQFVDIEHGAVPEIILGNLNTTRDFTDVSDMVKAYVLASEKCLSGEIYNLGSGQGYTIAQIVEIFQKITGQKVQLKEDPALVRESDVPILIANSAKFRQATGWEPKVSLETTISAILDYWRTK